MSFVRYIHFTRLGPHSAFPLSLFLLCNLFRLVHNNSRIFSLHFQQLPHEAPQPLIRFIWPIYACDADLKQHRRMFLKNSPRFSAYDFQSFTSPICRALWLSDNFLFGQITAYIRIVHHMHMFHCSLIRIHFPTPLSIPIEDSRMVEQKSVFVTGALSGIGYQLCKSFAKRGFKVYGCAPERFVSQMDPLKELGVTTLACDITNTDDIKRCKDIILKETGGKLDILYNNAGIALGGPATELADEDIQKIFKVNVFGHIAATREFANAIIKAKGTIVFTSSVAGRAPLPMISLYCSTKAAIDQYAHVLGMELEPFGVKVVSVITGGVNTAIGDNGMNDLHRFRGGNYDFPETQICAEEVALMARKCPIKVQPEQYAERVVNKITGWWVPLNIYEGGMSWMVNFLGRFSPVWVQRLFLNDFFKFNLVAAAIRRKLKEKRA